MLPVAKDIPANFIEVSKDVAMNHWVRHAACSFELYPEIGIGVEFENGATAIYCPEECEFDTYMGLKYADRYFISDKYSV